SRIGNPARTERSCCAASKMISPGSRDVFRYERRSSNRDCQDLRSQTRAMTNVTWLSRHERANAIAGKFAFRFIVKPLHLRHQTLKRLRDLFPVTTEFHFDRHLTRSKI